MKAMACMHIVCMLFRYAKGGDKSTTIECYVHVVLNHVFIGLQPRIEQRCGTRNMLQYTTTSLSCTPLGVLSGVKALLAGGQIGR
jgi:hypothetical protein